VRGLRRAGTQDAIVPPLRRHPRFAEPAQPGLPDQARLACL